MNNKDIIQVSGLADASLELLRQRNILNGPDLDEAIAGWKQVCESTIKSMGVSPEMEYLQTIFKLSNEAIALICLVILPQSDSRYINFYAQLSGKKDQSPNLDIVSSLVTTTYTAKSKLLLELDKESPVFYWKYLVTAATGLTIDSPLSGSQVLMDFILWKTADTLNDLLTICFASPLNLTADNNLIAINNQLQIITGGFEERQLTVAIKFASRPLYRINVSVLMAHPLPGEALKEAMAFVTLKQGIVYWQNALQDFAQYPGLVPVINNWLFNEKNTFIAGEVLVIDLPPAINPFKTGTIQLRPLTRVEEKEVWEGMGRALLGDNTIHWETMNNSYTMNMARIGQTLLRLRQGQNIGKNSTTAMLQDCYLAGSPPRLGGIAYLNSTQHTFNDMELSDSAKSKLDTLEQTFFNRAFLDANRYPGVLSIFKGNTGNGKTMAAECLANALRLPVYRMDYAQLENTSKAGLAALFDEAEVNSAALLFDEADALFSLKSNDGSLTTAFLIQKIESYGGLTILTTNAEQKIDPAFFRRAVSVIDFPALNAQQRYGLFQKLFSKRGVQLDSKVDLTALTKAIQMTGRNINNIVNASIINALAIKPNTTPLTISADNFSNAIKQETK